MGNWEDFRGMPPEPHRSHRRLDYSEAEERFAYTSPWGKQNRGAGEVGDRWISFHQSRGWNR